MLAGDEYEDEDEVDDEEIDDESVTSGFGTESVYVVSGPTPDRIGPPSLRISPKYLSVSLSASS